MADEPRDTDGRQGKSYGHAGGYSPVPGQSVGDFEGPEAGAGSPAPDADQTYTGQTGTGYGRTAGGDAPQPDGDRNLLDRARDLLGGDGDADYDRSDRRISSDVSARLTDDPFLDASQIEVSVLDGEVTLSGTVTARADKRRAGDLADDVSGVKRIQNSLRVREASAEG